MAILQDIARVGAKTYDYLTPGSGSNRVTDLYTRGGGGGGGWGPGGGSTSGQKSGSAWIPWRPAGDSSELADQRRRADALARQNSLLQSLRPVMPADVDWQSINAQARKQAASAVNPKYTKELNRMLSRMKTRRTRAQQDYNLTAEEIASQLAQAQEANQLSRTRTAEDVDTNMQQLATAEDQFQTESGTAFDEQRLAEAQQLAAGGLTTSGIGRQQAQKTIDQQATAEEQQGEEFNAQRQAQAVFEARTFEDLAKSDVFAGERAEKGKSAAKLNLDRLIEDIKYETTTERRVIEASRQADIATQTSQYGNVLFNNYLRSIADPRVRAATASAYGSLF